MSLQIGIVGLANVGKSTLFNALLKRQQALAANYPFATIEPNVGVVPVPDERLAKLAEVIEETEGVKPPLVPATVEFVDIAGLVAGAHKGEGLGNKFLSHVREVDVMAHVVRDFEDGEVVRTGTNLEEDYQTVINELILKDLETLENVTLRLKKERSKEAIAQMSLVDKLRLGFNEGKRVREILREDELEEIREWFLLTAKKQIVVVNVGEERLVEAESVRIGAAGKLGLEALDVVVISARVESELAVLDEADARAYLDELGVKESGLERLIKVAYERLGLISFLTAGEKEVKAWTIEKGTRAPQAAGVIHTDFERKFIKAEVIDFEDFVELGGMKAARENGKLRLEGREYEMKEGDVVEFKIGS